MSLPKDPIESVPEETARIAQAPFPKGNIYMMKMRDELGPIYENAQFVDLFPRRGQSAESLASGLGDDYAVC